MLLKRLWSHLITTQFALHRKFPQTAMTAIEEAIRSAEQSRTGQIRIAIEANLPLHKLLSNLSPRARAIEVFSDLRVWDTEHNNGVLIYLCLADRQVEIVADRGINLKAGQETWEQICHQMETAFKQGDFQAGVLSGIASVSALLETHYGTSQQQNELADSVVVL